ASLHEGDAGRGRRLLRPRPGALDLLRGLRDGRPEAAGSRGHGGSPSGPVPIALSVAGREYPPVEVTIDPARVAAFARALGPDPADGVPPTFAVVYAWQATAHQVFEDPDAAI